MSPPHSSLFLCHSNKIESVSNLQEAYRVVEQIETQERQTDNQKAMQRVREFNKTGTKSEGWRRGTDDKLAKEEAERDERIENVKRGMAEAETRQTRRSEQRESFDAATAILEAAATQAIRASAERQRFKERIKVSQSGESDQFIEALMDYLDDLENDSRRIEACQNIIKVCRNVAAKLQQEKIL